MFGPKEIILRRHVVHVFITDSTVYLQVGFYFGPFNLCSHLFHLTVGMRKGLPVTPGKQQGISRSGVPGKSRTEDGAVDNAEDLRSGNMGSGASLRCLQSGDWYFSFTTGPSCKDAGKVLQRPPAL